MNYIALIDNGTDLPFNIADVLHNMGYKKCTVYASHSNQNKRWIKEKGEAEIQSNKSLIHYTYNNTLRGIQMPIGRREYVSVVDESGYEKLRDTYGNQVIAIKLVDTDEILPEEAVISTKDQNHYEMAAYAGKYRIIGNIFDIINQRKENE